MKDSGSASWGTTIGLRPLTVCLAVMLAVGARLPRDGRLGWLRGMRDLVAEIEGAGASGYYEGLLNAGTVVRRDETRPVRAERPPGWTLFVESGIVEYEPGFRRWRMKPGVETVWNGTRFRTNQLGYRSPEIAVEKPPGVYRVVVLGSSNTMGHGVDDEDVYLRRFEDWLNEAVGPAGPRVEVVNLASAGETPSQRLVRLREEVGALQPDWVVCDASVIDVSLEELHLEQMVRTGATIPLPYVSDALARAGVRGGEPGAETIAKLRKVSVPLLEGAYAGLAEEGRRLGVPVAVVLLPRADAKAKNPGLCSLIRSLCDRNALALFDLFDCLDSLPLDELRVAPWDNHPSTRGHRMIFEALRDRVVASGGCPGLPLRPDDAVARN